MTPMHDEQLSILRRVAMATPLESQTNSLTPPTFPPQYSDTEAEDASNPIPIKSADDWVTLNRNWMAPAAARWRRNAPSLRLDRRKRSRWKQQQKKTTKNRKETLLKGELKIKNFVEEIGVYISVSVSTRFVNV